MSRKRMQTEEEAVDYSKFNIEELLQAEVTSKHQLIIFQGIEFRNPDKAPGGWLPLEAYDDKEFEQKRPADWLKVSNV